MIQKNVEVCFLKLRTNAVWNNKLSMQLLLEQTKYITVIYWKDVKVLNELLTEATE